jgi:anti-sigma factor RsiW
MNPKIIDILSQNESTVSNDELAKYLSGKLDEKARHEVEMILEQGDEMEHDAWEGWQQAASGKVLLHAEAVNRHIEKELASPQKRIRKKPLENLPITWILFTFILIIVLIAWAIIRYSL